MSEYVHILVYEIQCENILRWTRRDISNTPKKRVSIIPNKNNQKRPMSYQWKTSFHTHIPERE